MAFLKVNKAMLNRLVADEGQRSKILVLVAALHADKPAPAGMTFDSGQGNGALCLGVPSLADEKRIRQLLKQINPRFNFSRALNLRQRCDQYRISFNVAEFDDAHAAKVVADTTTEAPAINVLVEQPTTEPTEPAAGV